MATEKEIVVVKYIIVGLSLIFSTYLGLDAFQYVSVSEHNVRDLSTISEFGQITLSEIKQKTTFSELAYSNRELNFTISKPNDSWQFDENLTDILQKHGKKLYANGFLGGVYITNNDEKVFLVSVFDLPNKKEFLLDSYISSQIVQLSEFNAEMPTKFISDDNSWALIGFEVNDENTSYYGEQLLHYHDGLLYSLQYQGAPSRNIDENRKEEIRSIIDSFEMS